MYTYREFVVKYWQERGEIIDAQRVRAWTIRGKAGIVLPHEMVNGSVRIDWQSYLDWESSVNRAKARTRKKTVA